MEEKLGIETFKKGLLEFADVVVVSIEAAADKKVKLGEWFQIGKESMEAIPFVIKNAKTIAAEVKDLDDEEKAELNLAFKERFDLPNDKVEMIIEKVVDILVRLADLATIILSK